MPVGSCKKILTIYTMYIYIYLYFFLILRNCRSIKFVCLVFFFKSLRPLETRKFTRQIRCCGNIQLLYILFANREKINSTQLLLNRKFI